MSRLGQNTPGIINAEKFRLFRICKALPSLFLNRRIRTSILLVVLSALTQVNLNGCLILPMPASTILEKPFQDESKASIKVGISTKEEVENILGKPDATRRNGSIYIFAKPYIYMKLLGIFATAGAVRDIETHHLLIVQFDNNGVVKEVDHITGNGSKTQTGIFVADTGLRPKVHGGNFPAAYAPVSQMLVLYGPGNIESNSKYFSVPAGKSAIYAYCEPVYLGWFLPENAITKVSVSLDLIELGDFGGNGFFYWIVDPGNHSIRVTPIYPSPQYCHPDALSIECLEGQISFVELTWEWKGFFTIEQHAHLNMISDSNKGREEIIKRRIVLDCLTPID